MYKQEGDMFGTVKPGETLSTILQFQVYTIGDYEFVFEDLYIGVEGIVVEEIIFEIDGYQLEEAMEAT